jgi:hypothetical protein
LNIQAEVGKPKRFPRPVPEFVLRDVLRDIGSLERKLHSFEIILCAAVWEASSITAAALRTLDHLRKRLADQIFRLGASAMTTLRALLVNFALIDLAHEPALHSFYRLEQV